MAPTTTPTEAIYVETGSNTIETITTIRKLNMEVKLNTKPNIKTNKVREENSRDGLKDRLNKTKESLNINPDTTIKQATQILDNKSKENTDNKAINTTKMSYLLTGKRNWTPGRRPHYINEVKRLEVSTIVKAKTRMLDIKQNYKHKYPTPLCQNV